MRRRTNSAAGEMFGSWGPLEAQSYRAFGGNAHFGFSVKKFFCPLKNKIQFFFLSILAAISSLKPAGGAGREQM